MNSPGFNFFNIFIVILTALPLALLTVVLIKSLNKRVFIAILIAIFAIAPSTWVLQNLPIKFNFHYTKTSSTNSLNSSDSRGNDASVKPWKSIALYLNTPKDWKGSDETIPLLKAAMKKYGVDLNFLYLPHNYQLTGPVDSIWRLNIKSESKLSLPFQTEKELSWDIESIEINSLLSAPHQSQNDQASLNLSGDGKINLQVNGLTSKHELHNIICQKTLHEIGKSLANQLKEKWETELFEEPISTTSLPEHLPLQEPEFLSKKHMPQNMKIQQWLKHPGFLYGDLNIVWGTWDKVVNDDILNLLQALFQEGHWKPRYGSEEKLLDKIRENGPNSLKWDPLFSTGANIGWLKIQLDDIEKSSKFSFSFGEEEKEDPQKSYRFQISWTSGKTIKERYELFHNYLNSDLVMQDPWMAKKAIYNFPLTTHNKQESKFKSALITEIKDRWNELCLHWMQRRPLDYRLIQYYIQRGDLSKEEKISYYDHAIENLTGHAKLYSDLFELKVKKRKLLKP